MKIPTRKAYKTFLQAQRGKQFHYDVSDIRHINAISKELKAVKKIKKRGFKPIGSL